MTQVKIYTYVGKSKSKLSLLYPSVAGKVAKIESIINE